MARRELSKEGAALALAVIAIGVAVAAIGQDGPWHVLGAAILVVGLLAGWFWAWKDPLPKWKSEMKIVRDDFQTLYDGWTVPLYARFRALPDTSSGYPASMNDLLDATPWPDVQLDQSVAKWSGSNPLMQFLTAAVYPQPHGDTFGASLAVSAGLSREAFQDFRSAQRRLNEAFDQFWPRCQDADFAAFLRPSVHRRSLILLAYLEIALAKHLNTPEAPKDIPGEDGFWRLGALFCQ